MKNRYHIIQIIPSDSGKTVSFKIRSLSWKIFGILIIAIFAMGVFFVYKLSTINAIIISSRQVHAQNEMLLKKQQEYEMFFSELDSISTMEKQIKNILGTFYETDSSKLSEVIEKNRFNFIPRSKNRFNAELQSYTNGGNSQNWPKVPSIIPTIGIISKQFSSGHTGIDISARIDEPVFATAEGKVLSSAKTKDRGLHIQIDHGNGYITSYSHLQKTYVRKGELVKKGEAIGTVGSSGNSTGPHIHYEILKDNTPVDPELFIEE
ncbi:MAG: M23 family metallopeptidase [Hallerella sp.]|nr:M23 family metallopeptidase [Fibrobacter sp.]MDY6369522.1 M23 family metallopeptidase [Fibrobacter sp.]MDY6388839.1 M23 family metallopeptidase [Fibrobacter sp.]MEE3340044.1 M23 family metallopeptidase [Hallerella sp.]